jgi:hypothetical protein
VIHSPCWPTLTSTRRFGEPSWTASETRGPNCAAKRFILVEEVAHAFEERLLAAI